MKQESLHSAPDNQPHKPSIYLDSVSRGGPREDEFSSYYFCEKKELVTYEDTHFHSPVEIKFCTVTGFSRDLDSILPFKGKLKTAFSTFSPVKCLVIYVCPA